MLVLKTGDFKVAAFVPEPVGRLVKEFREHIIDRLSLGRLECARDSIAFPTVVRERSFGDVIRVYEPTVCAFLDEFQAGGVARIVA